MRIFRILICTLLISACSKEQQKDNPPSRAQTENTHWFLETETDDFRKQKYAYTSVISANERKAKFSIACQQKNIGSQNIFLSLSTSDFLGESEEYGRITYYIIDRDDPVIQFWVYSDKFGFIRTKERILWQRDRGATITKRPWRK